MGGLGCVGLCARQRCAVALVEGRARGMSIVVGIDPGYTGAAAAVATRDGDGSCLSIVDVHPFRFLTLPAGKVFDAYTFRTWICGFPALPEIFVVERAQAMPRQGVSSSFQYGRGFGAIEAVVLAWAGAPVEWVSPAKWKRALRLPSDKRAAIDLATVRSSGRRRRNATGRHSRATVRPRLR